MMQKEAVSRETSSFCLATSQSTSLLGTLTTTSNPRMYRSVFFSMINDKLTFESNVE